MIGAYDAFSNATQGLPEQFGIQRIYVSLEDFWLILKSRLSTLPLFLIQSGVIGDVTSIIHQFDTHLVWVTGTRFDSIPHWLNYDYSIHWFDIAQCWLGHKTIQTVRAREYRIPDQPPDNIAPWAMWSEIQCQELPMPCCAALAVRTVR